MTIIIATVLCMYAVAIAVAIERERCANIVSDYTLIEDPDRVAVKIRSGRWLL